MIPQTIWANNPSTTVAAGASNPAGGTVETWTVASSSSFPAAAYGATQFHVADPAAVTELVTVQKVSGTTWTVVRGAESTTPVTHAAGFTVVQVATAGDLAGVQYREWEFPVEASGAVGDGKVVTDAGTTSGSKTITSATAGFVNAAAPAGDVGKVVMINGGNGTATGPLLDVIASVTNSTTAVLTTNNAGATASNCAMVWGTDDTAAINTAITAAKTYALANNYFSRVRFGAKIYMLGSAPTQAASPQTNAQLVIPWPNVNGLSRKLVTEFIGAGVAGNLQYWESTSPNVQGTALVSAQTAPGTPSGSFGQQSVLGGPSAGGAFTGSFANAKVHIDGITVWYPWNTNMYAYDFGYLGGATWGHFSAQCFAPALNLSGASAAHPYMSDLVPTPVQSTIGVGCRFPVVGNNDEVAGISFAAQGINTAVTVCDHFVSLRMATLYCDVACKVQFSTGLSSASHDVVVPSWSVEQFNGLLTCDGGGTGYARLNINFDTESIAGGDPVYDVNDNGNLYGIVRVSDTGRTNKYLIVSNGAPNLKIMNDMMGPGYWSGAPAVPAASTNLLNKYRDAHIIVTGGTGVAISVGGQSTGLSSGSQVFVPYNTNINLGAYTGSPTWKWWLE